MKLITTTLTIAALAIAISSFGQDKYKLENATVDFFSDAPLEDIQAINKTTVGIVDTKTDNFTFRIKIKDFVFDSGLMQGHFNENYMESEKFPHGTFKGEIKGDYSLKKDGIYSVVAFGEMNIHGVVKKVEIPVNIIVKKSKVSFKSEFKLALEDYGIEIPTVVFQKIAEIIDVKIESELVRM